MSPGPEPPGKSPGECRRPREPGIGASPESQGDPRVSAILVELTRVIPPYGLTLHELLARLGERALWLTCIVAVLPFLLPVSLPGSSLPFGVLVALNGVAILTHRSPWLPPALMRRRLPAIPLGRVLAKGARLFNRLERVLRPRLFVLTHGAIMPRLNGILLVLSGLLLTAPLPLPFSNTLPAYAVLLLAAGSLERDGAFVLAGYVMVLLTLAYFGIVAVLGGVGVQALWICL
jgi:hypothetical protein